MSDCRNRSVCPSPLTSVAATISTDRPIPFDPYLTNPQAVIKGGVMAYRQAKPEIRQAIIAYLKGQP